MNLSLFFDHFSIETLKPFQQKGRLGSVIKFHTEEWTAWKSASLAIIGVPEYRGNPDNKPKVDSLHVWRQEFYQLTPFEGNPYIADLGNLRIGPNLEETYLRLKEVCESLIRHNILPIIIGGGHDLDYGQYLAYESMDKIITMVCIDAQIDLDVSEGVGDIGGHVGRILKHHPNYLFEYAHLGYQKYLNNNQIIKTLHKLNYELWSVGEIRTRMEEVEPVLRSADMMSFDVAALKRPDGIGRNLSNVFGLTGEEACKLCWYAGLNEQMTSVGFYEYNTDFDPDKHTARVLSIMVWYFIEGFSNRQQELSFKSNFHIKYMVPIGDSGQMLVFYKSRRTDKWWMEIPLLEEKSKYFYRNQIIPCSYKDYEQANRGIIPDRMVKAVEKLS